MANSVLVNLCTTIIALSVSVPLSSQDWEFVKEKDGISIYTREEEGSTVKSFKGTCEIEASPVKVFTLMEDVSNTSWWDKNLTQIKVLKYEKNKMAQYYLVYDLPWPVTDRDLCVEATIMIDNEKGEYRIDAVPLPGLIPEKKDLVRITDYRQTWTIRPAGKDKSLVELEGLIDPSGSVPDWISNMLLVDSPFKSISGVREQLQKIKK